MKFIPMGIDIKYRLLKTLSIEREKKIKQWTIFSESDCWSVNGYMILLETSREKKLIYFIQQFSCPISVLIEIEI